VWRPAPSSGARPKMSPFSMRPTTRLASCASAGSRRFTRPSWRTKKWEPATPLVKTFSSLRNSLSPEKLLIFSTSSKLRERNSSCPFNILVTLMTHLPLALERIESRPLRVSVSILSPPSGQSQLDFARGGGSPPLLAKPRWRRPSIGSGESSPWIFSGTCFKTPHGPSRSSESGRF